MPSHVKGPVSFVSKLLVLQFTNFLTDEQHCRSTYNLKDPHQPRDHIVTTHIMLGEKKLSRTVAAQDSRMT